MIANRFNPLGAKLKIVTAKDYIQDGLIHQFDGVENVGFGETDTSTTVWRDLVGTRDLTCVNVKWENGLAVFDGTAGASESSGQLFVKDGRTLEAVFSASGNISNKYFVVASHSDGATNANGLYRFRGCISTYNGRFLIASGRNYSNPLLFTHPSLGDLTSVSATYFENTIVNCYADAVALTQNGRDYRIQGNSVGISVGCNNMTNGVPTFPSVCKVASVRLYDKVLTDAEIAHNYAVDKERFCL